MPLVLIADDVAYIRDMYKMPLIRDGYTVEEAVDGPDALAKADSLHPDLILLDVMMPKMNGLDVLKLIKTDPKTKAIPVIILTALAQDTSQMTSSDIKADDYISKADTLPNKVAEKVQLLLAQHAPAGTKKAN